MRGGAAIVATFASVKTMADGTPRVTLDLQCSLAELASLGCEPGIPFALARLTQSAATTNAQRSTIAKSETAGAAGPLCTWAVMRCKEPAFEGFLRSRGCLPSSDLVGDEYCKQAILATCHISSRRQLDENPAAARVFREQIMTPWKSWVGC